MILESEYTIAKIAEGLRKAPATVGNIHNSKTSAIASAKIKPNTVNDSSADKARQLVPAWTKAMGEYSAGMVLGELSDKLECYINAEQMELSELASFFSVREVTGMLQKGIDEATADIFVAFDEDAENFVFSRGSVVDIFHEDCRVLLKPYLESISFIEFAGIAMVNKSPSIVAALIKENDECDNITLLGLAGVNRGPMVNYLEDDCDETTCTDAAADNFDECVQESMNQFDLLLTALTDSGSKLLTDYILEGILVDEEAGDTTDIDELVTVLSEPVNGIME